MNTSPTTTKAWTKPVLDRIGALGDVAHVGPGTAQGGAACGSAKCFS